MMEALSHVPDGYIIGGLWTATAGVTGSVLYWFARKILAILEKVERIAQSLYGSPDARVPDGLLSTVASQGVAIDTLATNQVRMEGRLTATERTCRMVHGDIIVRGEE